MSTVEIPTSDDLVLFDGFTTYQQARSFTANTLRRRRLSLRRFARFMEPSSARACALGV